MENKSLRMIEAGKSINEIEEFLKLNKNALLTLVSIVSNPDDGLDREYKYVFKPSGRIRQSAELIDCLFIEFENMITINPDGTIDVYEKTEQYNEIGFTDGDYIIKSSPAAVKAFNKCMKIRKYNSK